MAAPRLSSARFLLVSAALTPLLGSGFVFLSAVPAHPCPHAPKLVNAHGSKCNITCKRTEEEPLGMFCWVFVFVFLPSSEYMF